MQIFPALIYSNHTTIYYCYFMSSRLLSVLILVWVVGMFVLLYLYFFVHYTSTLVVRANVSPYTVELYAKSVAQSTFHSCPLSECQIGPISPVDYTMTISSEWYKSITQSISIAPKTTQSLELDFQKDTTLKKIERVTQQEEPESGSWSTTVADIPSISPQERIQQIRRERNFDFIIQSDQGDDIWVRRISSTLEVYYLGGEQEIYIWGFDAISRDIRVLPVRESDYLGLIVGSDTYFYNTVSQSLIELDLVPEIRYIKPWNTSSEFVFISDIGAFEYSLETWVFEYFYLFRDFVFVGERYIGVIYDDEEQKKRNYNLEENSGNLIISYDPDTQERYILYSTNLDITEIFIRDEQVFFMAGGEGYVLDNY